MRIRDFTFNPGHLKQRLDLAVRWHLVSQRLRRLGALAPLWLVSPTRGLSFQLGLLLLLAGNGMATTFDALPVPYCKVAYDGPPSYTLLESKVSASDPEAKSMAQFVLEAFAQANFSNGLLDPVSQSTTVTALNQIQAMWVPSSLNFKSNFSDSGVSDNNTVEFVTESLVQISYRFPQLLAQYGPVNQTGTIENLLSTLLSECQIGVINHHFTVGYTNQWLFRLCNMILSGQGIVDGNGNVLLATDPEVVNRGRSDFLTWVSTVRNNGVHEFMSPTYTGLDLEALGYIQLYAQDPGIAMMAQQSAKLIWIDMYANWYNQNQRMGGTHSRTYEFLTDEDRETDRFFYAVSNLITQRSPAWPILLNTRSNGYWRGQDFIAYTLPPPSDVPYLYSPAIPLGISRTILRSFLSDESNYDPDYMYGENYMANPAGLGGLGYPFSVGSTESFYNDETFEGLTIMTPGVSNTANINFNMQGRGDYYLQILTSDAKATTLKPFIAAVQNAAETLFLAASTVQQGGAAIEVASSIVIPITAQVWIGSGAFPESLTSGQSVSLNPGSVAFIQVSNPGQTDALVTGIRFLISTNTSGNPVSLSLVNDGVQFNALRITCIHSSGTPTGGEAVVAIWTRTAYCPDTSTNFNAFRNALISAPVTSSYNVSTGDVSLSVPGLNSTMAIQTNVRTQSTTSSSGADLDSAFTIPLLSVNGAEFVTGTLQDWTSDDIGNAAGGTGLQRTLDGLFTGQIQVVGGGPAIWGTADAFQFYHQTLTGDGTLIGHLTSLPNGGSTPGEAGLMMRNDLTPGSANVLIGNVPTFGQFISMRSVAGSATADSAFTPAVAPYWFKLTRVGNRFTGYSSPDGSTWTMVGAPAIIAMNPTIYLGPAVTSRLSGSLIAAGFDSVGVLQQ
jgi:hypothetical protein